jgi:hypothetical protein
MMVASDSKAKYFPSGLTEAAELAELSVLPDNRMPLGLNASHP